MLLCIDADVYTYPGCPQFHLLLQKKNETISLPCFYCYYAHSCVCQLPTFVACCASFTLQITICTSSLYTLDALAAGILLLLLLRSRSNEQSLSLARIVASRQLSHTAPSAAPAPPPCTENQRLSHPPVSNNYEQHTKQLTHKIPCLKQAYTSSKTKIITVKNIFFKRIELCVFIFHTQT